MLVLKELICICQYSHVRLYLELSCVMSEDKKSVDCEMKARKVKILKINVFQCCPISQKNLRATFTQDICKKSELLESTPCV